MPKAQAMYEVEWRGVSYYRCGDNVYIKNPNDPRPSRQTYVGKAATETYQTSLKQFIEEYVVEGI